MKNYTLLLALVMGSAQASAFQVFDVRDQVCPQIAKDLPAGVTVDQCKTLVDARVGLSEVPDNNEAYQYWSGSLSFNVPNDHTHHYICYFTMSNSPNRPAFKSDGCETENVEPSGG